MRKGITIFSFKKLPGGFIILLSLFILTEGFIYSIRPNLIDDFWNKFIINEHYLIDLPRDYEYLIMGDSLQKTGINPTKVSDRILNLGLPGSKPCGLYLMLKRYLKKHKTPKAIFLYIDPEPERDSFFVILRYFVTNLEFISVWRDLTWRERQIFMVRYWTSLDLRKVGLTVRDKYPNNNRIFVSDMKKNAGYMPAPRSQIAIADNYFSKTKERSNQDKISMSKRDIKYLHKFMRLAASYKIKIVFLGIAFPKELHDILEKTGFNNDYIAFVKALKWHYPDIYFVKDPVLFLENRYFGDPSHVNKNGSYIYTEYFRIAVFPIGEMK